MGNLAIDELNKIKEAEDKAKAEGNEAPFAFKSEVSNKIYVF